MKKVLYGTTALATAGLIAGAAGEAAAAEPIKLKLDGYHQQFIVFSDQDDTATGADAVMVDEKHNSEICFTGETTLDNGLTFGINVQLEGNTSGDQIDESFLFIESDEFGRLLLGDENNAGYLLHVGAPDGGISVDSGDVINNTFFENTANLDFFDTAVGTTNLRFNDNDSGKITYITPRVFGFQAGVSYIPILENGGDSNTTLHTGDAGGDEHNGVAGGLNYKNEFAGIGVQASGGLMWAEIDDRTGNINNSTLLTRNDSQGAEDDLVAWNTGLQLSFAGFSLGGAYSQANSGLRTGAAEADPATAGDPTDDTPATSFRSHSYTVGAAYAFGPYKVGANYFRGFGEGNTGLSGLAGTGLSTWDDVGEELTMGVVSGTYTLGPGIRLVGGFFYFDQTNEAQTSGADNDGWGFASGFKLGF